MVFCGSVEQDRVATHTPTFSDRKQVGNSDGVSIFYRFLDVWTKELFFSDTREPQGSSNLVLLLNVGVFQRVGITDSIRAVAILGTSVLHFGLKIGLRCPYVVHWFTSKELFRLQSHLRGHYQYHHVYNAHTRSEGKGNARPWDDHCWWNFLVFFRIACSFFGAFRAVCYLVAMCFTVC